MSNDAIARSTHDAYVATRDELGASYRSGLRADDVDLGWTGIETTSAGGLPAGCARPPPRASTLPATGSKSRPCPITGCESGWHRSGFAITRRAPQAAPGALSVRLRRSDTGCKLNRDGL
jgi:hypothetical protein